MMARSVSRHIFKLQLFRTRPPEHKSLVGRHGRNIMSLINKLLACSMIVSAAVLGGSAPSLAFDSEHKDEWKSINILFVPWSQSSNPFFEAVVNGAKDAAEQQGVNLDVQFGEEDQKHQLGILETGI